MRSAVKRGQIWAAKARRGHRYVRVERVVPERRGGEVVSAEAIVREVTASGDVARGRSSLSGIPRSIPFRIALTICGRVWRLPPGYREV